MKMEDYAKLKSLGAMPKWETVVDKMLEKYNLPKGEPDESDNRGSGRE